MPRNRLVITESIRMHAQLSEEETKLVTGILQRAKQAQKSVGAKWVIDVIPGVETVYTLRITFYDAFPDFPYPVSQTIFKDLVDIHMHHGWGIKMELLETPKDDGAS